MRRIRFRGRVDADRCVASVLLRLPAPRRRRPDRRAVARPAGRARSSSARPSVPSAPRRRGRRRAHQCGGAPGSHEGDHGQVAGQRVRRRTSGQDVAEGQADAHRRPDSPWRRMGFGRRRGWLSNLHLGARDPDGGPPIMVGKTFKGLTDELLRWQTEEFVKHESSRDDWAVYCARSWSSRSNWTACRRVRGTRAGWRCASRGWCGIDRTRPRSRPTALRPCGRCGSRGYWCAYLPVEPGPTRAQRVTRPCRNLASRRRIRKYVVTVVNSAHRVSMTGPPLRGWSLLDHPVGWPWAGPPLRGRSPTRPSGEAVDGTIQWPGRPSIRLRWWSNCPAADPTALSRRPAAAGDRDHLEARDAQRDADDGDTHGDSGRQVSDRQPDARPMIQMTLPMVDPAPAVGLRITVRPGRAHSWPSGTMRCRRG